MSSDYSNSDSEEEFEVCCRENNSGILPFDPTSLENVILTLCDKFNFRVVLQDQRAKKALIVTSGLTIAGTLIGKHYGGKIGATVGGAVGGLCGLGIVAVTMREIWQDIKGKLAEVYDIVYDYLAGLGLEDYATAAKFLIKHSSSSTQLALVIMEVTSNILGKQILSNLCPS